jgi:hypothetical protein
MSEDRQEKKEQNLQAAVAAIESDPHGGELFAKDPVGFLKSKGVETEGLYFTKQDNSDQITDADLAMVAGGGCVSFGYYMCYSEGS